MDLPGGVSELWCKVGNGPLTRLSLQELAKLAFKQPEDGAALLNAYGLHWDPLERLARLDYLNKAIWRRNLGGVSLKTDWQVQENGDPDSCDCRNHEGATESGPKHESQASLCAHGIFEYSANEHLYPIKNHD